jgi:neopullulanase
MTVPDWVKDAIFYQIFPDRFAQSDRLPKTG